MDPGVLESADQDVDTIFQAEEDTDDKDQKGNSLRRSSSRMCCRKTQTRHEANVWDGTGDMGHAHARSI